MIRLFRKAGLVSLLFLLSLMGCGVGDDDGERLGDYIVGTWQRGWAKGDVIIEGSPLDEEGEPIWYPEKFSYDQFIFNGDGVYNGMRRSGSFLTLGVEGDTIFIGEYRCDNNNLQLTFSQEGRQQQILAQVQSFTNDLMTIRYYQALDSYNNLTVIMKLRKK